VPSKLDVATVSGPDAKPHRRYGNSVCRSWRVFVADAVRAARSIVQTRTASCSAFAGSIRYHQYCAL